MEGIEPIDFRQLLRQERQNCKLERRNKKDEKDAEEAPIELKLPPWSTNTTNITCEALDRDKHRLQSPIPSIYYIQHYLTPDFAQALWDWIELLPTAPPQDTSVPPRTACWHRLPHAQRDVAVFVSGGTQEFPKPLQLLVYSLQGVLPQNPNHILINRYAPSEGILGHTDGPAYQSCTATISLGEGDALLQFAPRNPEQADAKKPQVVLHGGGSLVVFEGELYEAYMHSIPAQAIQKCSDDCLNAEPSTLVKRTRRISITIRHKKVGTES